ncbi:MAG: glycoside hydrolase family 172 protein, partial [Bacteroidales bacterium]
VSYSPRRLEKARHAMKVAGEALLSDYSQGRVAEAFDRVVLPGDSLVLPISREDAAISYLCVHPHSPNPEQTLRSAVLSLEFDGHRTVWVPIGEFFGTGYKLHPHKTFFTQTTAGGEMRSSWVMPFKEECRITYLNYGTDTIRLRGEIGLTEYFWNPRSMYFGASWHEYHQVNTRLDGWFFDVNYVDINGKGCYVGDQVTLFNMAHTWWGEGDEKIFVDGEAFPSSIGTGSEDYYGYAFARPEPFSHPFISQPTGAGNFDPELTVNMRHRALDAIPFTTSISSNIELWHWADTQVNYALTAYYYALYPYEINIRPDIEAVQRPVVLREEDFFTPAPARTP